MHRSLTLFLGVLAVFSSPLARAAVWTGTGYKVTGVWVGGGGGLGAVGSTTSVMSAGQPAIGPSDATASYILRPGFLQPRAIGVPGGGGGGGSGGVDPGLEHVLQFTLPTGCLQVTIPAGCFAGPVTMTAAAAVPLFPAVSRVAHLNGTVVAAALSVNPALSPRKALAVRACYRDQDVTGLQEENLRLAVLPTGDDSWLPLPSSPDTAGNRVTAAAPRLGVWRVVEVLPSATLSAVRAYPNPMAPGRGVMTFSNLPAGARLRLYSFAGELVREFSADDQGQALWNGLNGGGRAVASGTYFVFIEAAGESRTMKVQVQK